MTVLGHFGSNEWAGLSNAAEHLSQQIGRAGHRLGTDGLLLVRDFQKQVIQRLLRDVIVEVGDGPLAGGEASVGVRDRHYRAACPVAVAKYLEYGRRRCIIDMKRT